jgi:hypothetical protein
MNSKDEEKKGYDWNAELACPMESLVTKYQNSSNKEIQKRF